MIKKFSEFIAAHREIAERYQDTSSNVSVISPYMFESAGVVTYSLWSNKLERTFKADSPEHVLEEYQSALDGITIDMEIIDPQEK